MKFTYCLLGLLFGLYAALDPRFLIGVPIVLAVLLGWRWYRAAH